ncbi:MAG: rhamnulokinase [Oscillospiraceae bacterium]|jgi:rhamnulokinase/L-fuculokinase|nr:rhamnulokinase [Oscillospiraceae bacterium]
MPEQHSIAVDLGASSGRVMLGSFDGGKIRLQELHRFANDPVRVNGTLHWDILRLFHDIKQGLTAAAQTGLPIQSIGIDTWGVDFALLGEEGEMLENPVHYRDGRSCGMLAEAEKRFAPDALYRETGVQFMEFNTVFQLLSLRLRRPALLERAARLLFLPDLLGYFLTGKQQTEYSIASTSQLLDAGTGDWSQTVLDKLELPRRLLGRIVPPGTVLGELLPCVCEECGLPPVPVISVCGHDTQSAVTAVPSGEERFAFLSSGTWSLFGTELDRPIVNGQTRRLNITNEGGYAGKIGFLKNITGLWLIQESRRHWNRRGAGYSYADLERLALAAPQNRAFIDPDDPSFVPPGDLPARVQEFCRRTGQPVPEGAGEIIRCIYESLAKKYGETLRKIQSCTGRVYPCLHVIGGGAKDALLCQMTADACGIPVLAGPIEATVLGNIAVQLLSSGELSDLAQARGVIAAGSDMKAYQPRK